MIIPRSICVLFSNVCWLRKIYVRADFHSVEFSNWTGNPLFVCENVAVVLNRMSRVTNILLSEIQSTRKILLRGNQPSEMQKITSKTGFGDKFLPKQAPPS